MYLLVLRSTAVPVPAMLSLTSYTTGLLSEGEGIQLSLSVGGEY